MKIENTVTSIELSKELIKAGVSTETCLCWIKNSGGGYNVAIHDEFCYEMACLDPVPCFTVAELGIILKDGVMDISRSICAPYKYQLSYANDWIEGEYETEVEARGQMLLYLIKRFRLTPEEVNQRLTV